MEINTNLGYTNRAQNLLRPKAFANLPFEICLTKNNLTSSVCLVTAAEGCSWSVVAADVAVGVDTSNCQVTK